MLLPRHSIIFEMSRQSGEIPSDWKKGNNTHIFKKGREEVLRSFRLVSLTCACEGHGADPPKSYAEAHKRQGGDLRQTALFF